METVAGDTPKESSENAQANTNSTEAPTPAPQPDPPKKSKREDRNKKDDEYVKQFMKAINSASTVEEKVQIANQKYTHMVDDNKKMQFYIKQSEKRYALLMKEKDQQQLEYNKAILVKSKLENLCRELQKQNKAIKEESLHKIREEEERRKETQAKFQSTLAEITTLLHQNNEKNNKLRDDNIGMTEKFKSVVQQYQLREQQVEKMSKQMALEQQLADAKFLKANLEHQAERERLLAEMEGIKMTVAQYRARVGELQGVENGLRSQLAVYTDKYDEFQNALVKSNQVFGGFKDEMEKMSKKIKKLEKESLSWKKRWETSQAALLDMCSDRQASDERSQAAQRQLLNMQSLCRTMQTERTILLNTLKEHNIERPPLPAPTPAPPPPPAPVQQPASNAKVDAMAANCAQLRQSLAHLQSQLNVLTTKQQSPPTEEPPKTDAKKKSKSKKSKKVKEEDKNTESLEETQNVDEKETQTAKDETKAKDEAVTEENSPNEKVDDKTLESLIQAINNANINLCDLDVKDDVDSNDDVTKSSTSNDVTATSNEESPKNGPKIIELPDDYEIGDKIVEIVEKVENKGPKIVEIVEKVDNKGPKIVEKDNKPKIVEIVEKENNNGPKIVEIVDEPAKIVEITEGNEQSIESNVGPKEVAKEGIKLT